MLTLLQEQILQGQAELARAAFIRDLLTDDEKTTQSHMMRLRTELKMAQAGITEQQGLCTHPLVARQTKNEGSSGNLDRGDDCYWTRHICDICDLRWTTNQSWKNVGGRLGLPNDEKAKER